MTIPRIAHAIGYLDDDLVSGAQNESNQLKEESGKMRVWIKWTSAAACLAVLVMAGALILSQFLGGTATTVGGIDRNYKNTVIGSEGDIEFPWEYKLIYEKFPTVTYGEKEYLTRARPIGEALLEEQLGSCAAKGVDSYTNKIYREEFEVRKIKGVSQERMIAIGMDGSYYVYFNQSAEPPHTLGELLDTYGLSDSLPLTKFSVNEGYREKGYYQISDDAYLWQILSDCRDAEAYGDADHWNRGDQNYLSFTATSEALGVYKKVFYVTEDGFISTNVFNYRYVYEIGQEKAQQIIDYAKSNATEAPREEYQYTIAGTLTEIGDGYILIDDTVLCKKPSEGMVFRILTEDLQIRRYLECGSFKIGDNVAVNFQDEIVLGEDHTVSGAISMYRGTLADGNLAVAE